MNNPPESFARFRRTFELNWNRKSVPTRMGLPFSIPRTIVVGDGEIDGVVLDDIVREIADAVGSVAPGLEIRARLKSVQSKLDKQALSATKLVLDSIGVRLIVRDEVECYRVVNRIHARFPVLGSEYDDYIWSPKANGYRSIHTTILTSESRCVEVQVRTREMPAFAQAGGAAHRLYKPAVVSMVASMGNTGGRDETIALVLRGEVPP